MPETALLSDFADHCKIAALMVVSVPYKLIHDNFLLVRPPVQAVHLLDTTKHGAE